jgi:hypothetical protein
MLRRRFSHAALILVALAASACERPITDPVAPRSRPQTSHTAGEGVVAVDIGVLPGDARSEATHVTDDGVVYGYSYASEFGDGPRRAFRWTSATGMQPVSSVPASTAYPLPTIPAPPGGGVIALAANAKGEATGVFCRVFHDSGFEGEFGCAYDSHDPPFAWHERGFRYSRGGGLQDLDAYVPDPGDSPNRTVGFAINKWGHVAGIFQPRYLDDWRAMHWSPVDSMVFKGGLMNAWLDPGIDRREVLLNDNDRVVAADYNQMGENVFAFEPGSDVHRLLAPDGVLYGESYSAALAQNNGSLVVGRSQYFHNTGGVDEYGDPIVEWRQRAVVWTLPPVSRAAYPKVNANPITFTSTISLAATGGRYFQFYKGTQSAYAGPYVEHVDWGDGSSSRRTRTAIGNVVSQSHVYTRTGTYWIRVYVKDALGRWGVAERRLTVTS